jgi:hypothetical protein
VLPLRLVPLLRVLHQPQDQVLRELHDETHGELPLLLSRIRMGIDLCQCSSSSSVAVGVSWLGMVIGGWPERLPAAAVSKW